MNSAAHNPVLPGEGHRSKLPVSHYSLDWKELYDRFPPADVFDETVFRWSTERIRNLQNQRFLETMELGWGNPFYQRLWGESGVAHGDICSLEDLPKLPTFTSEDLKSDQAEHGPFGLLPGINNDLRSLLKKSPTKLQTSGGTTGKPRYTLQGKQEWELSALGASRALYHQGLRPGHIMQIPATCSLANLGWGFYKACHDYLGVMPLTTGSGIVTPSRKQLELAFDLEVDAWVSFPEYLIRLAQVAQDELKRDIRELGTTLISTFLGPDTEGSLRNQIEDLWGCKVYDNYGTNELGHAAFECRAQDGLHLMEDMGYLEVLDTETGRPVSDGIAGNLVVTSFTRTVMPVIRYNLRDVSRIRRSGQCSCGGNFRRLDHFLGRSDNMVRIKGVNVYPMACLPAVRSDPRTTGEWLVEAYTTETDGAPRDEITIHIEHKTDAVDLAQLKEHLETRLKTDLGLSVEVKLVPTGTLDSAATLGEGKASRLLERRPAFLKQT